MDAREAREWVKNKLAEINIPNDTLLEALATWREVARKHPRESLRQEARKKIEWYLTEAKRRNLAVPDED